MEGYIKVQNIYKRFANARALEGVNLLIKKGEFFSLLGGSGSGKTTLLRLLAGFEIPDSGKIFVDGVDITHVPPHERPINMVFQSYALFPHMRVKENIAFGLKGLSKSEIKEKVQKILDLFHMEGFEERYPDELSGGQRQRIALARSLIKHPKVLLLDEPMAALDKNLREKMQRELVNLQERIGTTFVMVTHDQDEAMSMSCRLAILHKGTITQVGTPLEIYENPSCRFVASFMGDSNLINGEITYIQDEKIKVESPFFDGEIVLESEKSFHIGEKVFLSVRPEKIQISRNDTKLKEGYFGVEGTCIGYSYLGSHFLYYVELKRGKSLKIKQPLEKSLSFKKGEKVNVSWELSDGFLLKN